MEVCDPSLPSEEMGLSHHDRKVGCDIAQGFNLYIAEEKVLMILGSTALQNNTTQFIHTTKLDGRLLWWEIRRINSWLCVLLYENQRGGGFKSAHFSN